LLSRFDSFDFFFAYVASVFKTSSIVMGLFDESVAIPSMQKTAITLPLFFSATHAVKTAVKRCPPGILDLFARHTIRVDSVRNDILLVGRLVGAAKGLRRLNFIC
jgi:hypothetical protein